MVSDYGFHSEWVVNFAPSNNQELRYMLQSGIYTFGFVAPPRIDLKVKLQHASSLDVFVYVNGDFFHPAVCHFVSLLNTGPNITDLNGTGPGTRWHRMGLGALAVNTAIQFLKAIYPPTATIRGHVFDAKDFELPEDDRPKRQADRKAFWRTFGFNVAPSDARGDEHLCGGVGDLKVVTIGNTLGAHPRSFDISQMRFEAMGKNAP